MKVIPLRNDVLVKPILTQAQVGLIQRTEQWQQDRTHAVVLAVGPGRVTKKGVRIPSELEVGQIVFIGKNPLEAKEIRNHGDSNLLVPEHSILAVLGADINPISKEWERASHGIDFRAANPINFGPKPA